jgi:hypothetical protein
MMHEVREENCSSEPQTHSCAAKQPGERLSLGTKEIITKEFQNSLVGKRPHSGSSPSSHAIAHTATGNPAEVTPVGQ